MGNLQKTLMISQVTNSNFYILIGKYIRIIADFPIGNIYMIGDNPKSDIRGANQAGW